MKYCIGVDVGGTSIKAGLFKEDGTLIEKLSCPTVQGENGMLIYDDAVKLIESLIEGNSVEDRELLGIGIDMPGPVYGDGRLGQCPNIGVMGGYPAAEITRRLRKTVRVEVVNDANASAFGEMFAGAGKGYGSICMVTLGTGVGGGIINEGSIVTGTHGAGGEIGHICVEDNETEYCNCGGRGCCEFYASGTGIIRLYKRIRATGDPLKPYSDDEQIAAEDVCIRAREGDEAAIKAIDFAMEKLGKALSYVTYVADPEKFIIGGGVSEADDLIMDRIKESIEKYTPLIKEKGREVIKAKLGADAGMYGAAGLCVYRF